MSHFPDHKRTAGPRATGLIRGSLRNKLIAASALSFLLISITLVALSAFYQYRAMRDKLVTEGELLARLLAQSCRTAVFAGNMEQLREMGDGAMNSPDLRSVTIQGNDGRLLLHLVRPGFKDGDPPVTGSMVSSPFRFDSDHGSIVVPIPSRGGPSSETDLFFGGEKEAKTQPPLGTIAVTMDVAGPMRALWRQIAVTSGALVIFLAVGTAITMYLIRLATSPLSHLAEGVSLLEGGDYNVRVPVESSDELGRLAESFNSMAASLRQRRQEQVEAAAQIKALNGSLEEKVVLRTEELQQSNRELASFNYSLSHDLRGPLFRLKGYCAVLHEDFGDRLDDEVKSCLTRIMAVGEQMERVVSAMTRLFHLQKCDLILREIDLSELGLAVAASVREQWPGRRVNFSVEPGMRAVADMNLIWQALENILGNAWKYTARSAEPCIEFGRGSRDGENYFYVRDNGVGFDMAYADKLFLPFQRLHGVEEFPGTGVGLAIVDKIIARHGGRVWMEGQEGVGAVFYFTLSA